MAPTPPHVRTAPGNPWPSSISVLLFLAWGPRHGPHTPTCSDRPGKPVAVLYLRAPLSSVGASTWPPTPTCSDRPGKPVAVLYLRFERAQYTGAGSVPGGASCSTIR